VKRFYGAVDIVAEDDGFAVTLDGKPVRTPAKRPLRLLSRGFADAVAAEWRAQQGDIDPARMPLTRLANTAIDRVAVGRIEVIAEVASYADTDLVCYRAEAPPDLVAAQRAAWQPLVDWAAAHHGAPLHVTTGVRPVEQPPGTLRAIEAAVAAFDDFALAALHAATAACRSVVIALALADGRLDAAGAWEHAHVDEAYQAGRWGDDPDEVRRLETARRDIAAAAEVLALCRGDERAP